MQVARERQGPMQSVGAASGTFDRHRIGTVSFPRSAPSGASLALHPQMKAPWPRLVNNVPPATTRTRKAPR